MSSLVERLANIELFSELSSKEIKKVASYMTTIDVREGRDLTVQGTVGREFMIIAEGEASVRRNGRLIATLGPGDFFGELAVIAGVPRTATVTAETKMVAQKFWAYLCDFACFEVAKAEGAVADPDQAVDEQIDCLHRAPDFAVFTFLKGDRDPSIPTLLTV